MTLDARPGEAGRVAPAGLRTAVEPVTETVEREWDALADATGASPFLRPGYMAIWRRAFAPAAPPPSVVTVRRGDDLVAALPVARDGGRIGPPGNFETVACGIVAEDDDARVALVEALLGLGARRVCLDHVDIDGPTHAVLARTAEASGHRIARRATLRSPVTDTHGGWDAYWSGRSRNLRHNVSRCRRRLE